MQTAAISKESDENITVNNIDNHIITVPSIYTKFEKTIDNSNFKSLLLKVAQIHE
jgi:hypothetical protein